MAGADHAMTAINGPQDHIWQSKLVEEVYTHQHHLERILMVFLGLSTDNAWAWTADHVHALRTSRTRGRMRTHIVSSQQTLGDESVHTCI